MTLEFPNQSRSYDDVRNRIRFWGYYSAIEISFFVEADALRKIDPEAAADEAGDLALFDAARERIHMVAREVYGRARKHTVTYTCTLSAEDF